MSNKVTDVDIVSTIRNEQIILRNELQELKKCQIQYFLLSVGATGAVFGFNRDLQGHLRDMIYLAPLLIIFPCWLTFFDKANTITRLTGYIRVFIEGQLRVDKPTYLGYENALSTFRKKENEPPKIINETTLKDVLRELLNITRNQYWKINWLTFLFLSVSCILYPFFKSMSFGFLNNWSLRIVYLFFICAEIICIIYSATILSRLIFGKYSYENVRDFWDRKVLHDE